MLWLLSFPTMFNEEKPFRIDQLCGVIEIIKNSNKISNDLLTKLLESVLDVISQHGTCDQTFEMLDLIK